MRTRVISVTLIGVALAISVGLAIWSPPIAAQTNGDQTEQNPPVQRMMPSAPIMRVRPALTTVDTAGPVVRITPATRSDQILTLRDDQMIETPAGHRMNVGTFRRLQSMFAGARARANQRHATRLALGPTPSAPGTPRRPGESAASLLARPAGDVVRLRSGGTITVAQLRAIAPLVERHFHVRLATAESRPNLNGPATPIATLAQLKSLPHNAPDSTILVSPAGTRITVGELRAVTGAMRHKQKPRLIPSGGKNQ